MKKRNAWLRPLTLLGVGAAALVFTGCSSSKPKPEAIHQRGWIGGEYQTVCLFPAGLKPKPKSAVLVTSLNTNTPAALAGLNEGDLILELNLQPATRLKNFRRTIDRSEPGTLLSIKTWRDGQITKRQVRVGRETFRYQGTFMVGLPGFFYAPSLWPNADFFSLGVLGYKPQPASDRKELSSAEERYYKNCDAQNYQPMDEGWKAWLVIMQAAASKEIRSQEIVPPQTGSLQAPPRNAGFSYVNR